MTSSLKCDIQTERQLIRDDNLHEGAHFFYPNRANPSNANESMANYTGGTGGNVSCIESQAKVIAKHRRDINAIDIGRVARQLDANGRGIR